MAKKSPFEPGFLGVDLYYDDQWNTVGADLLDGDLNQTGISVRHGASSEGGAADPSSLEFTVRNGDGKYNPRNPSSPLYGKIGRNTPARATVALGAAYGDAPSAGWFFVNDTAALRPTGDLDVRWWGSFEISNSTDAIMAKDGSDGNRGWAVTTDLNGNLVLWWYPTGASSSSKFAQSSAPIPAWAGEIALRVTLDVDNGAGGWTARFYYAASLDGPWVPFGTTTGTGVTSLYQSTNAFRVGPGSSGISNPAPQRVYGFEYRLGIDAEPISSYRFDRTALGYTRSDTVRRWNYFFDPVPAGPVATWSDGTNARVGVVDDPTHGMVVESYKKTASQAFPSMTGHAFPFGVNTPLNVAFDVLYEGPPGAAGVNFLYRPAGAGSVTGQSIIVSGLQNYTTWTRVSGSFNTGSTAPVAGSGFGVLLSGTMPAGARVLMRNIVITQGADTSPFSGSNQNTPEYTYAWAGARYAVPSAEYLSTPAGPDNRFADDQGRKWGQSGGAKVTNRHTVAVGEVSEWPLEWGKKGAPTVMTDVVADGVSRRLGQGQRPLNSPFYNAVMATPDSELLAYWPMEEEPGATRFSPAAGPHSMTWAGDGSAPALAAYSGVPGSKPLPTLGTNSVRGSVRQPANWTISQMQVRALVVVPAEGLGGASGRVLMEQVFGSQTPSGIARVELLVNDTGALKLIGYDWEDVVKNETSWVNFSINGRNVRISVEFELTGTLEVLPRIQTLDLETGGLRWDFPVWTGRSLWPIRSVAFNPYRGVAGTAVGHITVERSASSIHAINQGVMDAYQGEAAEARIRRLAAEKATGITLVGSADRSADMGRQVVNTWLESLADAEKADGGVLYDARESLGLQYRTYRSLGSQPAVVIEYEDNKILPFEPVDDDAMIRNRVVRTGPNDDSFAAVREDGALSVREVPDGVGIYEDSQSINVGSNDTLADAANWDMHVGTWDEGRYPTLGVDLADPRVSSDPVLVRELLSLNVGDRLVIKNPPPWLPPLSADVLVMGIQMSIDPWHVRLTWTCVPARPYRMGYWNHAGHRWSGEGTTLASGVTDVATTLPLTLPEKVTWTHADGDYDIMVGGERMTVTNVTGGNSMTVVRSVNGVVKAHSAGEAVSLAEPSFYSRRGK